MPQAIAAHFVLKYAVVQALRDSNFKLDVEIVFTKDEESHRSLWRLS